jgi:hypothetical protein
LRDRGVFIVASGNVVHNLRRIAWSHGDRGFDWGERFDSFVRELMTARPAALAEVERHPDYTLAVPTAEHFLPLAYLAGLCSAAGEPAAPFAVGCALGSLSMASYLLGMSPPPPRAADRVRGMRARAHAPGADQHLRPRPALPIAGQLLLVGGHRLQDRRDEHRHRRRVRKSRVGHDLLRKLQLFACHQAGSCDARQLLVGQARVRGCHLVVLQE